MRLAFIQDLDIFSIGGGAQLTDRTHFTEGLKRGHDIELVTPSSGGVVPKVDGIIVSNASAFPASNLMGMSELGIPIIWFIHDYFPICKYRLFYPMGNSCKSCYLKERWLPVLKLARLIIWLSPLHRESWLWLYPELEDIPYHLAPSPVSADLFYDLHLERKEGVISVEGLHPFKGRDYILRWIEDHPEVKVTIIGGNPDPLGSLPPNCRSIGVVPNVDMNEVYNQHEALLHLPQSPSPFDRTVAEAFLAGCKIIGNKNIGALSYDWFISCESVAEHCKNSPKEFWEVIENAL